MQDVTLFAVRDGTGREAETIRRLKETRGIGRVRGARTPKLGTTRPLPQAGPLGGTHPLSVCPTRSVWSRSHRVGRYRKVNGSTNIPWQAQGLGGDGSAAGLGTKEQGQGQREGRAECRAGWWCGAAGVWIGELGVNAGPRAQTLCPSQRLSVRRLWIRNLTLRSQPVIPCLNPRPSYDL